MTNPSASFGALRPRSILLSSALALILAAPAVSAQTTGTVTGLALDAVSGDPLAGVSVMVEGTTLGVVTGASGEFTLGGVPAGEQLIRAVRPGYLAATTGVRVESGAEAVVSLRLTPSPFALDGLVVTATGPQRRRELGNASTTIHVTRELERAAPSTLTALLQGRAPGVQVLQTTGTVGTSSPIRIRGSSSLDLETIPLIYVDGARVSINVRSGPEIGGQSASRLNDLTLDDIESVEVVRGPSAATLYGTEAAAGVIRITTRRGLTGRSEWTFRSEIGASRDVTDWPDVVFNPRGVIDPAAADTVYSMNLLRDGTAGDGTFGTPWRTGIDRTQGVSLRGGMDGVTYFLSGELSNREGVLPNNELSRRSVRANLNLFPSDRVDVSISTGFGSSDLTLPLNDNSSEGFVAAALVGFPWEMPIIRDDPVSGEENVLTCPLQYEVSRLAQVPIAMLPLLGIPPCAATPLLAGRTFEDVASVENRQQIERFTGSATVHWRPLSFLTGTGTVGYDQFSDQTGSFYPVDPSLPFGDLSLGARSVNHVVSRNTTIEGSLTASFDLGPELHSSTSLGVQFFRKRVEVAGGIGRGFPSGPTTISNALRTEGIETAAEHRILGVFLEQQFALRDRFFLTPAVRVDEGSAFGDNLGAKAYPRVMASYVLDDPAWVPAVESVRMRGAWGQSGKQPGSLDALQLLQLQRAALRGVDAAGVVFESPGNPDLSPETGTELELGLDADFLEGRLGLDLTWYHQTTTDALVSRRLPPSSGYQAPLWTNVGEIRNQGVEASVFAELLDSPAARLESRLTVGFNRGRVTQLDEPISFGVDGRAQRHQEGYPFGSFFSRVYSIGEGGEVEVTDDELFVGHPIPEYEGSFSSSLTLGGRVTFTADLGFAGGHRQFQSTEEFMCGLLGGGTYGGTCAAIFERGEDGELTDEARIKAAAAAAGDFGPWIRDSGFVRLRNLSARVELPSGWVQRIGADRGSFTLAGENLAVFTGYPGLDPETNAAGGSQDVRVEFLTLPLTRRVAGWLSITF